MANRRSFLKGVAAFAGVATLPITHRPAVAGEVFGDYILLSEEGKTLASGQVVENLSILIQNAGVATDLVVRHGGKLRTFSFTNGPLSVISTDTINITFGIKL